MDLTCRLRCSPLAKTFPHPSPSHKYILVDLLPAFDVLWGLFPAALRRSSREDIVGTRRPRLFFVRFGTGIGTGRVEEGRERSGELLVEDEGEVEVVEY